MEDFVKLFDSILTLLVSFPLTIFNVLASPEKVVGTTKATLTSPPGGTFVVSFFIYYVAHSTQLSIRFRLSDLSRSPSKTFLIRIVILVSFILLIQYSVLLAPFILSMSPTDSVTTMKGLSYPISVAMTIYGLTYLFCVLFPVKFKFHGLTIVEKLDPVIRNIRMERGTERIVPEENASFIANVTGIMSYVYALYNVIRASLDLSLRQAIFPTFAILLTSLVFMILIMGVFKRYDERIEKLSSQREEIPDKGEGATPKK